MRRNMGDEAARAYYTRIANMDAYIFAKQSDLSIIQQREKLAGTRQP